jgi:hypothetical protein
MRLLTYGKLEKARFILETTMQMSIKDESAPVECDICSKPLGKIKDVKHIESPEEFMKIVLESWKSLSRTTSASMIESSPVCQ